MLTFVYRCQDRRQPHPPGAGLRLFVILEDVDQRNPEFRAYLAFDLGRQ
jgi:hypothetical protein